MIAERVGHDGYPADRNAERSGHDPPADGPDGSGGVIGGGDEPVRLILCWVVRTVSVSLPGRTRSAWPMSSWRRRS